MKIKYIKGTCQNCKKNVDIAVDVNADIIYTENDLTSFNFYKNIGLSVCPHCGYIAQDITSDKPNNFDEISKTEKFDYLYNYRYIKNLDKVDTYEIERYAPNIYECYSYYMANQKNYEESIRYLYRAVELKLATIKIMENNKLEDYDDDEIEDRNQIDIFIECMKKSILRNQKGIVEMYKPNDNTYVKVMYIITLNNLGEKEQSQKEFEELKKLDIDETLIDYTKSKLEQKR